MSDQEPLCLPILNHQATPSQSSRQKIQQLRQEEVDHMEIQKQAAFMAAAVQPRQSLAYRWERSNPWTIRNRFPHPHPAVCSFDEQPFQINPIWRAARSEWEWLAKGRSMTGQ
jgi:hypothetical protein